MNEEISSELFAKIYQRVMAEGITLVIDICKQELAKQKQQVTLGYLREHVFSARLANAIMNGMDPLPDEATIFEIAKQPAEYFLRKKNFGRRCLMELRQVLSNYGLGFNGRGQ